MTRHFRIVVALDLSDHSDTVLEHALDQAARHERPCVHAIAVVPPAGRRRARLVERIAEACAAFRRGPQREVDCPVRLHVCTGRADEEIAGLAAQIGADLVVLGRFGAAPLARRGRRSLAERILHLAPCPTLVVQLGEAAATPRDACPDCVRLRRRSGGERWFCARHSDSEPGAVGLTPFLLLQPQLAW
jgi:nucleotide-binding universal stress UspA family protein